MSEETIINITNAQIFIKKHLLLSNVNLQIKKGECVFLVGKNGSGKSSFLKTLYGEIPLIHGEGTVAGFNLKELKRANIPFLRREIGIVFQDFQLLTDRSIKDNLKFVMRATGWKDRRKMEENIQELLNKVGLGTKGFKYPHELSGGEQQRVAIARALVNNPDIILADEPTGNLDPETSVEIMKLLFSIAKNDKAIIMATHDYELMSKFPGRTLKFEKGVIAGDAPKPQAEAESLSD